MNVIETTTLYNQNPGHNKFYTISVVQDSDGTYSVPFTYGPIDGWRKSKYKTQKVSRSEACCKYHKIIADKRSGGYTSGPDMCVPTSSGIPIQPTNTGTHAASGALLGSKKPTRPRIRPAKPPVPKISRIAQSCQLLTEIDKDQALELVQDDAFCAQEKKDGKRMKLDNDTVPSHAALAAINKKGKTCGFSPKFSRDILPVYQTFILDGESVGENYWTFDMMSLNGRDLRSQTYRDRLARLEYIIPSGLPAVHVVETAYTTLEKAALIQALIRGNKEGIIFKKLDATYTNGRGLDQFKYKFYATASCLVLKQNAKRSVALGVMDGGGTIIDVGNCTIPPNKDVPAVDVVVEIRYLYAYKGGSLYQPIYLGPRDDVDNDECVINQLKYKAA